MTRRYLFVRLPFFPVERFLKTRQQQLQIKKPWWDKQASDEKPIESASAQSGQPHENLLVLVEHGAKGARISAVGPQAQREGLWPEMKLNDARAMIPNLDVVQQDVEADRAFFYQLATWMLRYSPCVALYGRDGLVLEITGCDHLFGGEEAMAQDIRQRLAAMAFTSCIAIADTIAAGFALVYYGLQPGAGATDEAKSRFICILPKDHHAHMLDELPVEALRLQDDVLVLLRRLGLKQIGHVRTLPRPALERRFFEVKKSNAKKHSSALARSVQWRLDQLSGAINEPINFIRETQSFRITCPCPELALETGAIGIALEKMLLQLCAMLEIAGKGARRFCLTGYRADGGVSSVAVNLSQPGSKIRILKRLFSPRLEKIDCGFGIDLFILEAMGIEGLQAAQTDMVDPQNAGLAAASIAAFADIVASRTERQTVMRLAPYTSHVPERAQSLVPVSHRPDWQAWQAIEPQWSPRPLRLFARPEPAQVTAELPDSPPAQFVWRKLLRKVARSRGPERIMPEWWHDNLKARPSALFRDYYDVEDTQGRRYWIFRSIRETPVKDSIESGNDNKTDQGEVVPVVRSISWFVHGLF